MAAAAMSHGLSFDAVLLIVEGYSDKVGVGKFIDGDVGGGEASGSNE